MVRDRRRILDLHVKCPWCQKEMELRDLRDHKKKKCEQKPDDYEATPTPEPEPEEKKDEKAHEEKGDQYGIELYEENNGVQSPQNQSPNRDRLVSVDRKAAEEKEKQRFKEQEEKDRLIALHMQLAEQDKARELRRHASVPNSPVRSPSQHQYQQQQQPIQNHQPHSPQHQPHSPQHQQQQHSPQHRQQQPVQQVRIVQPQQIGEVPIEEIDEPADRIEYYQADEANEIEGQPGAEGGNIRQKRSGCCGCSDKIWCCICCVFWIAVLVAGVSLWFYWSQAKDKLGL